MRPNLLLAALSAFSSLVLAAPTSTPGTIVSPASGTVIMPGQPFNFVYQSRADYSVTSFNYTVWLFTSLPNSFSPTDAFSTGHFFGRFAEPNYPGLLLCAPKSCYLIVQEILTLATHPPHNL